MGRRGPRCSCGRKADRLPPQTKMLCCRRKQRRKRASLLCYDVAGASGVSVSPLWSLTKIHHITHTAPSLPAFGVLRFTHKQSHLAPRTRKFSCLCPVFQQQVAARLVPLSCRRRVRSVAFVVLLRDVRSGRQQQAQTL